MKKVALGALIAGVVLGVGISYITAIMVDKTSTPEFCASCHTMKPMVESFKFSIHGGNNAHGFAANHCTDCHLPHNSLMGYLIAKGISGTRDALAEVGIIKKVDFKENYYEMSNYVYDSACLHCHKGIEELKEKRVDEVIGLSKDIKKLHKEFYWKEKENGKKVSCVTCHNDTTNPHFAHPNLLETLNTLK